MGDADTANIQKLIKKVIETTRCSPAQAELALYDNDNNITAAVEYILDQGAEIESWTEQKTKKDKKKDDDERKAPPRGQQSSRGRGATIADRGARGGRGGGSQSAQRAGGPVPGIAERGSRGDHNAPRGGTSFRGRGQSTAARPGRSQTDVAAAPTTKTTDLNEESDWKGGQLEFKRSETAPVHAPLPSQAPSSSAVTSAAAAASATTSSASPISFAAVAAAANRREHQKSQPPAPPVVQTREPVVEAPPQPQREPITEPKEVESFVSEPSVANPPVVEHVEEPVPVNQEEPVNVVTASHSVQATSPQLQANVTWTSQLKNDLGIGVSEISAVKSPQYSLPGVEFATEAAVPIGLSDYHFGFEEPPVAVVPAPVVPAPVPVVEQPVHAAPESVFSNTRHSAAAVPPPVKPAPEMHSATLSATEYQMRTSPPTVQSNPALHHQARLGFADASTVSYNPPSVDRSQHIPKPLGGHMAPQQQAPTPHQPQQQHQPQQMFTNQMPFASYANPYMNMSIPNMYSPVAANMRPDDYTAALLQAYPFAMPGMDMANLIGGSAGFAPSSTPSSLSQQQQQHRSDTHGIDTMKFSAQTGREQPPPQQQQQAAVQPPPGFGNTPFGMQPQMNMLQQHYTPQPQHYAQFMMPNIGQAAAGGRQIYGQDDDARKSQYDKMSGVKPQQPQPPAPYHNGGHYGMGGNKKTYSWNS